MLIGEDYPKISFDFAGLTLLEPMAIVTNFIMAGVAFYCAWRIYKWEAVRFASLWKWFFISYGLAGFTSAFSHGFFLYLGWGSKIPAWGFGVISIVFMEFAMLTFIEKEQSRKVLQFVSISKAAMVMTLAFNNWNFLPVAINSVVSLLLIIAPTAYVISRKGVAGMRWIVTGILFLIPAAILYLGKINPHLWLNKDDLSHLLMAGSLFFFLNGVLVYQSQLLANAMKRV
jgi:hypothetical protein